ncbi:hypothetical protein BDP27DRAFT_1320553 [Rhodocollybia butyracea]|uniref:Uncharacterized protein n=1 Tax=Rhodocollybia butyracea TaxID=206335 RepID=A0A9P5UAX8_9AGAR|nr:hypothetical protein BDP27DRAFT_1320553 [Rhodocollybia butyracea]
MMDANKYNYTVYGHLEKFFLLFTFLKRSQKSPMMVSYFETNGASAFLFSKGTLHPFLQKFFGQTDRWQRLVFGSASYYFSMYSACFPSPLTFSVLNDLRLPYSNSDLDITDTAPMLKELELPSGDRFFNSSLPYSQLSHLNFNPELDNFRSLFSMSPGLRSLEIAESLSSFDSDAEQYMAMSCSPILELLTIHHGFHLPNSQSVLPFLKLPSLKSLRLKPDSRCATRETPWASFELFVGFVHRLALQLTTLSIQSLSLTDSNLVHLLIHLPTLQDLTLDDSHLVVSPISSEFIESLHGHRPSSLHPQTEPIIPRLHSLRLLNVGATVFRDASVVDMVQSRWIPDRRSASNSVGTLALEVDCLREFTMTFRKRSKEQAGDVYDSLEHVERDGMRVVVSWVKPDDK